MKSDREKCLEAGASDYLAKPVNTEKLLSASLRMWLHAVGSRDEHGPRKRSTSCWSTTSPAKLISYEVMLNRRWARISSKASSARVAFEHLLKHDIAVVLVDVCMPELDGFELAAMIRGHPRFERTAIIFVSAIHMADDDRLRGYRMGAVDYMPVPVSPDILRAKVKVFAELFRKTRQLEQLNSELERRVAERTGQLETSTARLLDSEQRRSVALAAGQMGSWDWDIEGGTFHWDDEHCRIVGVDGNPFRISPETVRPLVNAGDWKRLEGCLAEARARTAILSYRAAIPAAERRDPLVRRDGGGQLRRRRPSCAAQRRDHRHHRT